MRKQSSACKKADAYNSWKSIDWGVAISNGLDRSIAKWYASSFPEDDFAIESMSGNPNTFADLCECIERDISVYDDCLWVRDSVVRERCFERLSEIIELPEEEIWDFWVHGGFENENAKRFSKRKISGSAIDSAADFPNPYSLLDRCCMDVKYWSNHGGDNNLWAGNPREQYEVMEYLYDKCDPKPEWFTEDDLREYKRILVGKKKAYSEAIANRFAVNFTNILYKPVGCDSFLVVESMRLADGVAYYVHLENGRLMPLDTQEEIDIINKIRRDIYIRGEIPDVDGWR